MKIILFLLFILLTTFSFCQNDSNYFYHSPLDIPLKLSANFGELRPNHFHMGIDYRTNGVEGIKIFAIEDGYIARVKVSPFGYGKVVYINHPNGITSVYAHCSSFSGKLDSIVKQKQIEQQNFEIEFLPDYNLIPVKRGESFALSGNTGNSSGPHLHFELRDTKTEIALNPLINGFEVFDTLAPTIKGLKIYALTKESYRWPNKSKLINVTRTKNKFQIPNSLVTISSDYCSEGGIGFAIEANDHINGYTHEFSYFGSKLIVNNDTVFIQENDEITFDASKAINTHEDIEENKKSKRKFQKSFKTEQNPLEIYTLDKNGIVKVKPNDSLNVKYQVYDTRNNTSEIDFKLKVQNGQINQKLFNITNHLSPASEYKFEDTSSYIRVREGCVYEPIPLNFQNKSGITIGNGATPIHTPIEVKLRLKNAELPVQKYIIKNTNLNKALDTKYNDGWLTAESKNLGTFAIDFDTIAPSLFPLNFNQNDTLLKKSTITWKVNEEKTSLKDYDLFIDNQWQLLEYESKGSYLFYRRQSDFVGKHLLKIIVVDSCGNSRIWEKEITFE